MFSVKCLLSVKIEGTFYYHVVRVVFININDIVYIYKVLL
nr:MAG TPA: hypothetical protein [Caudoviricetes sp.]DAU81820.1 MAG TPA: hypothetical protein [Caudoviricetes sp.]